MKIQVSLSAKQIGTLYHVTTKPAMLRILRSGKLALASGHGISGEHNHQAGQSYFASLTRSRFGGYHFRDGGTNSHYEDTKVMITLDGTALSQNAKIKSVDYWGMRGSTDRVNDRNKEYEERLISNKSEIDIMRYVMRVDFIQRAVHGETESFFGKKTFKLRTNEQQGRGLASILLELKKRRIPFAFYDSMLDWAHHRNEYSMPLNLMDSQAVQKSRPAYSGSYKGLKALVSALSDRPYQDLPAAAQKVCETLFRYPQDAAAVFNDWDNNRKPDADPAVRALALKVSRIMQRKAFHTKQEAAGYAAGKYETWSVAQEATRREARNQILATELLDVLEKDVYHWPHSDRYDSMQNTFLEIKDRFGYLYEEAVRLVKSVLASRIPEVETLRQRMKSYALTDAEDLVSKIYYEKVRPYREQVAA